MWKRDDLHRRILTHAKMPGTVSGEKHSTAVIAGDEIFPSKKAAHPLVQPFSSSPLIIPYFWRFVKNQAA